MIIEVIKEEPMVTQYVAIAAAVFAGIALLFNYFAFRKQQRNTKVNLLADFSMRFFDIIHKQKDYVDKGKVGLFNVMFLNLLEWFAYLINHKYLDFGMSEIYHGVIINWYNKVRLGQEEVLKGYMEDQKYKFSELDEFYKKLKNRGIVD